MSHTRRKALVALAMSAAAVGTGIGLGVSSAGAAPVTHQVVAAHHGVAADHETGQPGHGGTDELDQHVQGRFEFGLILLHEQGADDMSGGCAHTGSSSSASASTGS